MTGKRLMTSLIQLIPLILVVTIIFGAMGSMSAHAEENVKPISDARTEYITSVQKYYDELKTQVGDYNGTEVLESIKSSSDYLIGYLKEQNHWKLGTASEESLEKIYKQKE